jgi:hypothetical protein
MSPTRRTALLAACLFLAPCAAFADAPVSPISDDETRDPPTQERLQSIEAAAAASGWAGVVVPLRDAAMRAYSQDRFVAAGAWFDAYRWASLFSEPEDRFISDWIGAVMANGVNYEGVAGNYEPTTKPIGSYMSPELQDWVVSNLDFSDEFFSNFKAVDHLPNVFGILDGLYRRDPRSSRGTRPWRSRSPLSTMSRRRPIGRTTR